MTRTDPGASHSPPFTGFTEKDRAQLRAHGVSEARALAQLEIFRKGQTHTRLERACTLGDGIEALHRGDLPVLIAAHAAAAAQGRALQFVPASGAATRMFKSLTAVMHRPAQASFSELEKSAAQDGEARETIAWFHGLRRFPYYPALSAALAATGKDLEALIAARDYGPILERLLSPGGLNYSERPKALIPFHSYAGGARTSLEEHLAEAAELVRDGEGICRLHFTVSPDHERDILAALESQRGLYAAAGIRFETGISRQQPATDTLAAAPGNDPLRNADDTLCFRPGGHGALLENLSGTGGDIVFIRNIDNVVPQRLRAQVLPWRQAMGGHLVRLRERICAYLDRLRAARALLPADGLPDPGGLDANVAGLAEEIARFTEMELRVFAPEAMRTAPTEPGALVRLLDYLIGTLDRPLRVCAMVRNQGEPGGGPFWVRAKDGSMRPQIVESAQVDMADARQRAIAASATHFNPVDLVCALRDTQGRPYPLRDFVDEEACFITSKSKDGMMVKALELPGLWNGSMAYWNTVFVELPVATFNPVKTVNDLLRESHQGVAGE